MRETLRAHDDKSSEMTLLVNNERNEIWSIYNLSSHYKFIAVLNHLLYIV